MRLLKRRNAKNAATNENTGISKNFHTKAESESIATCPSFESAHKPNFTAFAVAILSTSLDGNGGLRPGALAVPVVAVVAGSDNAERAGVARSAMEILVEGVRHAAAVGELRHG